MSDCRRSSHTVPSGDRESPPSLGACVGNGFGVGQVGTEATITASSGVKVGRSAHIEGVLRAQVEASFAQKCFRHTLLAPVGLRSFHVKHPRVVPLPSIAPVGPFLFHVKHPCACPCPPWPQCCVLTPTPSPPSIPDVIFPGGDEHLTPTPHHKPLADTATILATDDGATDPPSATTPAVLAPTQPSIAPAQPTVPLSTAPHRPHSPSATCERLMPHSP